MLGLDTVITEMEARQLNPVVLAFVGDAVYSLYVRKRLALSGGGSAECAVYVFDGLMVELNVHNVLPLYSICFTL